MLESLLGFFVMFISSLACSNCVKKRLFVSLSMFWTTGPFPSLVKKPELKVSLVVVSRTFYYDAEIDD